MHLDALLPWGSAERCEELLEATRADEELLGGRSHRVISDEELLGGRDYIYIYIDETPRSH